MFGKNGTICAVALAAFLASPMLMAAEKADSAADQAKPAEAAASEAKAERPNPPEGEIGIKGSRRTVMFSHQQGHKDISCVSCHHKVKDQETFKKCSTSGCHDDLKAKKGEHSLYFVMHNKGEELKHTTCMSCHVKTVADKPDLKKKLTGCSGSACHPGKKGDDAEEEAKS